MTTINIKYTACCFAAIAFFFTVRGNACDVPVFRYALERWASDPYEIIVMIDGEPGGLERKAIDGLVLRWLHDHRSYLEGIDPAVKDHFDRYDTLLPGMTVSEISDELSALEIQEADEEHPFQYQVSFIDLSQPEYHAYAEWLQKTGVAPPAAALRYPRSMNRAEPIYVVPLDGAALDRLLNSPVRNEIARRLIDGHSAVWAFLECGDADKDAAALKTLKDEAGRIEKELHLPAPDERAGVESIFLDETRRDDLRLEFSIVTVSRHDDAERALVSMLTHSEPDLPMYEDQPMVFPIYGQGRALYALIGSGINRETVEQAGEFLVGPCSCQIKEENPGVDLLIPVDWKAGVTDRMVLDRPTPSPMAPIAYATASAQASTPAATYPASRGSDSVMLLVLGLSFGAFILAGAGATAFILIKQKVNN
ncbi:MAG: hypothetical protein GC154_10435 [bacterium]|nr:hypothetical protein [bacterium]